MKVKNLSDALGQKLQEGTELTGSKCYMSKLFSAKTLYRDPNMFSWSCLIRSRTYWARAVADEHEGGNDHSRQCELRKYFVEYFEEIFCEIFCKIVSVS